MIKVCLTQQQLADYVNDMFTSFRYEEDNSGREINCTTDYSNRYHPIFQLQMDGYIGLRVHDAAGGIKIHSYYPSCDRLAIRIAENLDLYYNVFITFSNKAEADVYVARLPKSELHWKTNQNEEDDEEEHEREREPRVAGVVERLDL